MKGGRPVGEVGYKEGCDNWHNKSNRCEGVHLSTGTRIAKLTYTAISRHHFKRRTASLSAMAVQSFSPWRFTTSSSCLSSLDRHLAVLMLGWRAFLHISSQADSDRSPSNYIVTSNTTALVLWVLFYSFLCFSVVNLTRIFGVTSVVPCLASRMCMAVLQTVLNTITL